MKGSITIMTKCIATVGDVFVGTKDNVSIEDIDKCDLYPCVDNVFLGRALIVTGAIYNDDGIAHFSIPFKYVPLTVIEE